MEHSESVNFKIDFLELLTNQLKYSFKGKQYFCGKKTRFFFFQLRIGPEFIYQEIIRTLIISLLGIDVLFIAIQKQLEENPTHHAFSHDSTLDSYNSQHFPLKIETRMIHQPFSIIALLNLHAFNII